jgi:arsenite methyltransferase
MSKKRPEMFNKRAAKPKYKADQIMETLSLKPGQIIADIGSGGGYFTCRFA